MYESVSEWWADLNTLGMSRATLYDCLLVRYDVGFKEANIELVQAGMLIALWEFSQDIEDRALVTLGTCSRLAGVLA
jgi:hypothetical protein